MARYGEEYRGRRGGYDAGHGRGYDTGDFRGWGEAGYDRGYSEGWGMEGLYHHMMGGHAERGRGGYSREYDSPFGRIAVGQPRRIGGEGRSRLTGMESNRQRGVYGSDLRVGHGGDYAGYPGRPRRQGSTRHPGWAG